MSESDDLRQFLLRFDRRMDQHDEELRAMREENRVYFEKLRENTEEIIAEGRAGREALFRIFDRLDNGGAASAG